MLTPMKAKSNSVIIFDDLVCDKQSTIRDYFRFDGHIKCFYLSQTSPVSSIS